MSLQPLKITAIARDDSGGNNIIPNAPFSVVNGSGGFPQLWEEREGLTPVSNPGTCDANGERQVWVEGGYYSISVGGGQSWEVDLVSAVAELENYAAVRALNGSSFSQVSVAGRTSVGDGGEGLFVRVSTGSDDGGVYLEALDGSVFKRVYSGAINAKWYVSANGSDDSTPGIRSAMSHLESVGGGVLWCPPGVYLLQTSDVLPWCVQIPANVTIDGEKSAIFTRPAASFDAGTVLFVNKGADTASGYDADGNIAIRNITINDVISGGVERTSTLGDVIGIAHAENFIFENINFGSHSQHCVDVGGCKNVTIKNCTVRGVNGQTGYSENSAFQVDSCNGASAPFVGVGVLDGTQSEGVRILHNDVEELWSNTVIHIGHNGGIAKDIVVESNRLVGSNRTNFAKVIRCDSSLSSLDNVSIVNNRIHMLALNNTGIAFEIDGNNSEYISGLEIKDNSITGLGRQGIVVGGTTAYTGTTEFTNSTGISVVNNTINIDCTGSTVENSGIKISLVRSCAVRDNFITLTKDTDSVQLAGVYVVSSSGSLVSGNVVFSTITGSYVGSQSSAQILVAKYGAVASNVAMSVFVESNKVDVSALKWGIASRFLARADIVRFSENDFSGALVNGDAHIYESTSNSSGNNGMRPAQFADLSYEKAVSVDTVYPMTTGLKKISQSNYITSKPEIRISYSQSGVGTLSTNTETTLTNGTTMGMQVKNISQQNGTFDLVTGQTAITATMTPGGPASARVSGAVSVVAGI